MEHHIQVSKTVRFETTGNLEMNSASIWFVLHGYGQLAKYFIKKFEPLKSRCFVIAPEGPHRFYLTGNSGRVGASWMTKEWREQDIEDNINALTKIYNYIKPNIHSGTKVGILGFSQGAATAVRWASSGQISTDHLILWAGHLPPDMNYTLAKNNLIRTKIDLVLGKQDPYFLSENESDSSELLANAGIPFTKHLFEGGHDIDLETLLTLL